MTERGAPTSLVGGVTYAMGEETDTRREIIASVEYLVDPAAETPEVEKVEEYTFVRKKSWEMALHPVPLLLLTP